MDKVLDRLLALLDKLLTVFTGLTIGYGLADKKRREIEVKLAAVDLERDLLKNERDVEKEFDELSADDAINRVIRKRSNRDH